MRPPASITSASGGASRAAPMRVIVSFSIQMSPLDCESALTICALRISKAISMNLDPHSLAILLHSLPVFGHFGPRFRKLIPRDRVAPGRNLGHLDAFLHRTDVITKTAADTIPFPDARLRPVRNRLGPPVRCRVPRVGLNCLAWGIDEVDALVRRVVAGRVAEITFDAARFVYARGRAEGQVEIFEIRDPAQGAAAKIGNCSEVFGIHPVRKTVA